MKVAQLCLTLCDTQSMEFSRPEYWDGQPIPSPADLPNPGIEPGSPALQVDFLPTELSGKHDIFVGNVITILTSSLIINLFSFSLY